MTSSYRTQGLGGALLLWGMLLPSLCSHPPFPFPRALQKISLVFHQKKFPSDPNDCLQFSKGLLYELNDKNLGRAPQRNKREPECQAACE